MIFVIAFEMMKFQRMFSRCPSLIFNLLWLNFLVHSSSSMHLTNMTAPPVHDPREDMPLHCGFDMGTEELYAVKWYKDDHEFFRYSPGKTVQKFNVSGVEVHDSQSQCTRNSCDLVLTNLSRPLSSGAYRCEVSSEAPSFRLASETHNVTVAALPKDNPTIEGLRKSYNIGEMLSATCTSDFGDPKPTLSWYINKQQIESKLIKELSSRSSQDSSLDRVKLKSSTIQMKILLDKKLTRNQPRTVLEVSCVSSVEGINPALARPLTTTKQAVVEDQNQLVNNQKLHWPNAASSRHKSCLVWIVLTVLIVWC